MSNQTFYILTIAGFIGMVIILVLNLTTFVFEGSTNNTYIAQEQVRGMAVQYQQKLYTLNFDQQVDAIKILNFAVPTNSKEQDVSTPDFQKLIIYQFSGPDVTLTPVALASNSYVFLAPDWKKEGYLKEISNGGLKRIISQTHD